MLLLKKFIENFTPITYVLHHKDAFDFLCLNMPYLTAKKTASNFSQNLFNRE